MNETGTREEKTIAKRIVLNISRMTTHNGPGIRTLIMFKGCPLRCLWCSTPESQKSEPELLFSRANAPSVASVFLSAHWMRLL